jgi:hypothetical protein
MPTNIKCTREGLVGSTTKSGYVIDKIVPFVALPCVDALHRRVRVRNLANDKSTIAIVLDVGPWNEHDREYVFGSARPQAENGGPDERNRKTNGAGIDLGERVRRELDMVDDNGLVDWEFVI